MQKFKLWFYFYLLVFKVKLLVLTSVVLIQLYRFVRLGYDIRKRLDFQHLQPKNSHGRGCKVLVKIPLNPAELS